MLDTSEKYKASILKYKNKMFAYMGLESRDASLNKILEFSTWYPCAIATHNSDRADLVILNVFNCRNDGRYEDEFDLHFENVFDKYKEFIMEKIYN